MDDSIQTSLNALKKTVVTDTDLTKKLESKVNIIVRQYIYVRN